jgi:hypothetical protein
MVIKGLARWQKGLEKYFVAYREKKYLLKLLLGAWSCPKRPRISDFSGNIQHWIMYSNVNFFFYSICIAFAYAFAWPCCTKNFIFCTKA